MAGDDCVVQEAPGADPVVSAPQELNGHGVSRHLSRRFHGRLILAVFSMAARGREHPQKKKTAPASHPRSQPAGGRGLAAGFGATGYLVATRTILPHGQRCFSRLPVADWCLPE